MRADTTARASAHAAISQYTARQPVTSASTPDSSGPTAVPSPIIAPYRPVARIRSVPEGKAWPTMPRLAASIAALAPP